VLADGEAEAFECSVQTQGGKNVVRGYAAAFGPYSCRRWRGRGRCRSRDLRADGPLTFLLVGDQ